MTIVRDSIYARVGGSGEAPYVVDQNNGWIAGVRETYEDGSIILYLCIMSPNQDFKDKNASFLIIGVGYDKAKDIWYNFTPNRFYNKTNSLVVNNDSYVNKNSGQPCNKTDKDAIALADFWVLIYKQQIFPAIQQSILGKLNSQIDE